MDTEQKRATIILLKERRDAIRDALHTLDRLVGQVERDLSASNPMFNEIFPNQQRLDAYWARQTALYGPIKISIQTAAANLL